MIFYQVLSVAQVASGFIVASTGAILKADAALWPVFKGLIVPAQSNAFWIIPTFTLLTGTAKLAKDQIKEPWFWDTLHSVLERIRESVFSDAPETEVSALNEKVILFQFRERRWRFFVYPSKDWLCGIERSGHMRRRRRRWLRVPDHGRSAEGVAGQAWTKNQMVIVTDLPPINGDSGEDVYGTYSKLTSMSLKWLRAQRYGSENLAPRALCAFPVEVAGNPWGVLLIVSSYPSLPDPARIRAALTHSTFFLEKLLKRR